MKKLAKPSLQIAEPCHESWNQMTPEAQGRFCGSCSKIVLDFTTMTDQQIIDHLSKTSGSACGRFTTNQLNRPLAEVLHPQTSPKWLGMVAATLSVVLIVQPMFAFNSSPSSYSKHTIKPKVVHHKFAYPLYLEFSGVITDSENGKAIPYATLHIAASGESIVANADGTFYLKIMTEYYQENPMVYVTSDGFENAEFDLSMVQREMEISLKRIPEIVEIDSAKSTPTVVEIDGVVHLDVVIERDSNYVLDACYIMGMISPSMGGARHSNTSPDEPDIVAQFWNAIVDLFPKKKR